MDQVGTVEGLHTQALALYDALATEIDAVADPLLESLRFADELVHLGEQLRGLLLRHARRHGASWTAISTATGVAPTTWRDRYTSLIHATERV
jgi:hypothetical protein